MSNRLNLLRIKTVYEGLGEIQNQVVFVGGATASLYASREYTEIRPTEDVDVIIELLNYTEMAKFEEQLLKMKFSPDIESKIICRYKIHGVTVDIMPTTKNNAFGFFNRWYPEGYKNAVAYKIDDDHIVKILSSPYFLATKFEAFKGRGNGDGRTSQDFEDIVYVLENRIEVWQEIKNISGEIKDY
ncbi:MAG TPA: hypothetical protein PKI01_10410 [Bacteroidales bacterium]|nr:hypothetical protein [Bacteroidales bacterium]